MMLQMASHAINTASNQAQCQNTHLLPSLFWGRKVEEKALHQPPVSQQSGIERPVPGSSRSVTLAGQSAPLADNLTGLQIASWDNKRTFSSFNDCIKGHGARVKSFVAEGGNASVSLLDSPAGNQLILKEALPEALEYRTLDFGRGDGCALLLESHPQLAKTYAVILKVKDKNEYFLIENPSEIPLEERSNLQIAGLICEKADGQTLKQYIKTRLDFDRRQIVTIASQLAEAVAHLHQQKILHRDLSAQNVIVDPSGQIKIVDFDSIKQIGGLTRTHSLVGAYPYRCPQQFRDIDQPLSLGYSYDCDTWALGTLIMSMMTQGALPVDYNTCSEKFVRKKRVYDDNVSNLMNFAKETVKDKQRIITNGSSIGNEDIPLLEQYELSTIAARLMGDDTGQKMTAQQAAEELATLQKKLNDLPLHSMVDFVF